MFINVLNYLPEFPWQFILFSQIFYHALMLAIANILKRNFSFGEMAIVAQALTVLAAEVWLITVNQVLCHYRLTPVSLLGQLTYSGI
jgi:hypothetical protein